MKNYKYSIKLSSELSHTLYKERNFNLDLELVDQEGKSVRNCNKSFYSGNLVNLCCAVCTEGGEWIHENRVG